MTFRKNMLSKPCSIVTEKLNSIPFQVYWDPPENISLEDPLLPEPRYEMLIRDVGIQEIVDAVSIEMAGSYMSVSWNGDILGKLIPEQRQVITAHLGHILAEYFGTDSSKIREYIIKTQFHQHIQMLAELEEEPGEFA